MKIAKLDLWSGSGFRCFLFWPNSFEWIRDLFEPIKISCDFCLLIVDFPHRSPMTCCLTPPTIENEPIMLVLGGQCLSLPLPTIYQPLHTSPPLTIENEPIVLVFKGGRCLPPLPLSNHQPSHTSHCQKRADCARFRGWAVFVTTTTNHPPTTSHLTTSHCRKRAVRARFRGWECLPPSLPIQQPSHTHLPLSKTSRSCSFSRVGGMPPSSHTTTRLVSFRVCANACESDVIFPY